MELFNTLFGIEAERVKASCIIMPFITRRTLPEFRIKKFSRGMIYGSGNGEFCTVFHTRMGDVFTGDAVLYLAETPCRDLYFLGTCGLLQRTPELKIGSLVSLSCCYAQESFTSLLSGAATSGILTSPDPALHRILMNAGRGGGDKGSHRNQRGVSETAVREEWRMA